MSSLYAFKLAADTVNGVFQVDDFPIGETVYHGQYFLDVLAENFNGVRYGAVTREQLQQIAHEYGVTA